MNVYFVTGDAAWGKQQKHFLARHGIYPRLVEPDKDWFVGLCRASPPDVLLLDMESTEADICNWIDEIGEAAPLAEIIVLGSTIRPEHGVKMIRTGAFNYLSKESRPEALVSEINKAFKKKRRNQERVESLCTKLKGMGAHDGE